MTEFNQESMKIKDFKKSLTVQKPKKPTLGLIKCMDGCGALIKSNKTQKRCKPCSGEYLIKHNREKYYNRNNATTKRSTKTKSPTTT